MDPFTPHSPNPFQHVPPAPPVVQPVDQRHLPGPLGAQFPNPAAQLPTTATALSSPKQSRTLLEILTEYFRHYFHQGRARFGPQGEIIMSHADWDALKAQVHEVHRECKRNAKNKQDSPLATDNHLKKILTTANGVKEVSHRPNKLLRQYRGTISAIRQLYLEFVLKPRNQANEVYPEFLNDIGAPPSPPQEPAVEPALHGYADEADARAAAGQGGVQSVSSDGEESEAMDDEPIRLPPIHYHSVDQLIEQVSALRGQVFQLQLACNWAFSVLVASNALSAADFAHFQALVGMQPPSPLPIGPELALPPIPGPAVAAAIVTLPPTANGANVLHHSTMDWPRSQFQ